MLKLTLIFNFVLVILLSACNHRLTGYYKYEDDYIIHKLELRQDNSFQYQSVGDLMNSVSLGTWEVINGYLILNSFAQYQPYQITESTNNELKKTIFKIIYIDGIVIPGNYITIDGDLGRKFFIDDEGKIELSSDIKFDYFTIYASNGEYKYETRSGKSNIFEINYNSVDSSNMYFNEDSLKIKRNKLIWPESQLKLRKCRKGGKVDSKI